MLKRISVQQLTVGMYLREFCGSWMEHPFWRTSFVITDAHDIRRILASSITQVWIDCAKGADVGPGEAVVSTTESDALVDAELHQEEVAARPVERIPAAAEYAHAADICAKAKRTVIAIFREARMGRAIDTVGAEALVEEIFDSVGRNTGSLISLVRLKTVGDFTYMHSVAVCALMIALARRLGLDHEQTCTAGLAGLLHDLGKATLPKELLDKPGQLSDSEFSLVKRHPEAGIRMLRDCGIEGTVLDVCLNHHARRDGSGYPNPLKGDEISLFAGMAAVCDVYDAITSNRPYKRGWDPAESMRKMAEWTSGHFDPKIFHAFVKCIGIFPIGSLVLLSSGRLGVVVEQSATSLLKPRVKTFFSTKLNARIKPEIVDLSDPACQEALESSEDPTKWQVPDLNELWSGLPGTPW